MPLLLAITLVSAIFVFVGNLCANILYPIIDPRIREGMYNDR
jgi:possible dipeptide/oligopeptide/nickel (ni2+) ABC superfamily ATP binding cassette transport system, membrane protein